MTLPLAGRPRLRVAAFGLLVAVAIPGLAPLPAISDSATTAPTVAPLDPAEVVTLADTPLGKEDLDARGTALVSDLQRSTARDRGFRVSWNDFGTAASVNPSAGRDLGAASGEDVVAAARGWLQSNRQVLGVSADVIGSLELVNAQELEQSTARAVLFRQTFSAGGVTLPSARGGLVTVGIDGGRVDYVSSSLVKAAPDALRATAGLSPLQGWRRAAEDVGRGVAGDVVDEIRSVVDEATDAAGSVQPWTRLTVPGLAQEQQARPAALAGADGTVRPVVEANVVDVDGGEATAHTVIVDAVDGRVLYRENLVEHLDAGLAASNETVPFQGSVTPSACGPLHSFELDDAATRTIIIAATAVVPADDIVVTLLDANERVLASQDLLTSPEALTYTPGTTIPAGTYHARICPFDSSSVTVGAYTGVVQTSDQAAPGGGGAGLPLPKYRFFPSNPTLDFSAGTTPANDVVGCWAGSRDLDRLSPGCTLPTGPLEQPFSAPWDVVRGAELPSFTTLGNNANTAEAWGSPLTPGGLMQRPFAPNRSYTKEFTDAWNNSRCNPAELMPGGNDITYAVTNLNVAHNRMHDYSYGLGFTERNYNMQVSNLGRNTDPTRERDPEVGNVQAGAITGAPALTGLGRNNANQITLQDGIPGITNQYLFQPLAGAFYSPCSDGALDFSVAGHEYTHAITNRMIAGPDEGLTSAQGGAMGESWSDLVAAEYVFSHGYDQGTHPFVTGAFVTGNRESGIRNYAHNKNPLNYSNVGYDTGGPQVHADGEIWSGTMWDVRQALVDKFDARFPYDNERLQLRCAQGAGSQSPNRPIDCPGNRRWAQLMFDSFLLQANGAVSMLDMRDAFLAADRVRFDGANQKVIWDAFARRGMGRNASSPDGDSGTPRGGFASPTSDNGRIRFDTSGAGDVYVGRYQARSRPVADTRDGTPLPDVASFTPGTYQMLYVSPGQGAKRFTMTVRAGERRTVTVAAPVNKASARRGAEVIRASAGSVNADDLIDGDEGTNWAGLSETNVDEGTSPFVTVRLAGDTAHTISRVNVSALLRPTTGDGDADAESGSRFTALRKFALEACVVDCGRANATYTRFYTSPNDAFPAVTPRPTAGKQQLRSFTVPATRARAIRFVALENQCTGFAGYAGNQNDDPTNPTDCKTATDRGTQVRASELQVY